MPGKSHGSWSLVGYRPWGRKESDRTEGLHFHFHFLAKSRQNMSPASFKAMLPCLQGSGNLVPLLGPGVTPQNTDSFSSLPSLAEQLPRTKVASPDTWQTNAVLPHESIASLRCPPVFWGRSFENKLRSGCPSMRLERFPERIWIS